MKHTIVDKARMLHAVPLLSDVSTEVLAELAAVARVEDHPAGTVLFVEGTPADAFYVVIDGTVLAGRRGVEAFQATAGDEFGALAVLDERPRAFTATTTRPTQIMRIGAEDFLYLLEQHPRLARGVIRHLAREVRSRIVETGRFTAARE